MATATFVTTMGSFTVRLMPEHAPETVANLVDLARGGREWTDPRDGRAKTEPLTNAGPNTNGSQFFVTVVPTAWLTGKHAIFGEVTEGYEVVEAISKVPTGAQDRPAQDVVLERVEISEG